MKKQVKKIVFIAAILALLAVAWVVLRWIIPEAGKNKTIYITKLNTDNYGLVSIKSPDSDYIYHIGKILADKDVEDSKDLYYLYDGGKFDQEEKYGVYAQSEMKKAYDRSLTLEATEVVDENPTDYEQYGLTKDKATVVIAAPYDDATDAEPITLLIGEHNKVVTGEGYYCQLSGNPTVYLISTLNAGTFLSGPKKFLNTDIMPSFGTYYDEINYVTFTNRNGETFKVKRIDNYESAEEGNEIYTTFVMIDPYSCYVSDAVISEKFFDLMNATQIMEAVAMEPTEEVLTRYGFDHCATIIYDLKDYDVTLKVATPDGADAGVLYFMIDGMNTIYRGYGEGAYVDMRPLDMRSGLSWIHSIRKVGRLDINTPSGSYTLMIDDTVDNSTGTGVWVASITDNSTGITSVLSETNGRKLFTACISTTYDDLIVDEENPIIETTPSYSFECWYKNSDFHSKVSYYKVNYRQYAVLYDDADISLAGFTINVQKLKQIEQDIQIILSGGQIK